MQPCVRKDRIVFISAGDVHMVDLGGDVQNAFRLTALGTCIPHLSPDGHTVCFVSTIKVDPLKFFACQCLVGAARGRSSFGLDDIALVGWSESDRLSVRLPMNSSLCTEDWQVRKILLSTGQMLDGSTYGRCDVLERGQKGTH